MPREHEPLRTLLVLYPGCIAYETLLATELLHPRHPVDVATPDGHDHVASNGIAIRATYAYRDTTPAEYSVVLIPGGEPGSVLHDAALRGLLVAAHAGGALIGAVCAGPLLLGAAGLLRGRRFTHGYGAAHAELLAPFWAEARFEDALCVIDGSIVTAKAQGHIDLGVELARATGALSDAEAERRRAFYKGLPS